MRFVFSSRFYIILGAGLIPLLFSHKVPELAGAVLIFNVLVIATAFLDHATSRSAARAFTAARSVPERIPVGDATPITLHFENLSNSAVTLRVKDEYPPDMELIGERGIEFTVPRSGTADFTYSVRALRRGSYVFGRTAVRHLSKLGLVWCQTELGSASKAEVYPNMRRAREMELKALGAQSFIAVQRKAVRRGEGREFESMRDYVQGDELRHISWTATARRSKLTTRQYQIERDQNILIAIDAGRLMTGRIDDETKFETAVHASLAVMGAAARAGDNFGLVVFGRRIRKFVPPGKGVRHIDSVLEALHDIEPEIVEPSYARAFKFIASGLKKRGFIIVLTDLVDRESSGELISSLKLLRPRHLPLVATIGDRDLATTVSKAPGDLKEMFVQSAAEEIIRQRESALRVIETMGGLALDVTAKTLAPKLLQSYLKVKERGMI